MGLETFKEDINVIPFKKEFTDLQGHDKEQKKEVKDLFQNNAELSLMLAADGKVNMTDHQKAYYLRKLGELRDEVAEAFRELRDVTGFEVPKNMQGLQAADNYYKEIRKAA